MALWHRLLSQTRDTAVDERVLTWRYLENPHGVARAWVLLDDTTREAGGFTVVMPRRMRVAGRELLAWIGADFSILPRFRALGPALQLRRAARDAIDAGEADLLYSFPNERMTLIHERAGHARLGELCRYAHPISLRMQLARTFGSPVVGTVLALPVELVMRLGLFVRSSLSTDIVTPVPASTLDENFAAIAELLPTNRIVGVRDRAYLLWRYARQPGWHGGVLRSMRDQRPTGYLIFTEETGLLQISDIVAADDSAVVALITHAARIAGQRRRLSVSYAALEQGLWRSALTATGFRLREDKNAVYAYVPDRHVPSIDARDPMHWHLTAGDRDI
jgi:hypothetical protein